MGWYILLSIIIIVIVALVTFEPHVTFPLDIIGHRLFLSYTWKGKHYCAYIVIREVE